MKIKIITIISNIDTALGFEWVAKYLDKEQFEQQFIFLNPAEGALERHLKDNHFAVFSIKYTGKADLPAAFLKIVSILRKEKPQIVHTHLFEASIIGLTAAKLCGIKKRIHTRHHSDSNRVYVPKAVKYDRFINKQATDIIAISKNVADVLTNDEHVPSQKVHTIYHGLELSATENISSERIKKLRSIYNPDNRRPVIGVISRYIHLKGIQYIIPAFKELLQTHPHALLVLANAKGNYSGEIKKMLATLPPGSYCEIEFEKDLFALYKLFDVYVHAPITQTCEAFGQTYIEALAAGTPSVFTLSGIASEFIKNRENALVVDYRSSSQILSACLELLQNHELADSITSKGKADIHALFSIQKMIASLESLYKK
ncbi:MAG: hypothetical protein JWP12_1128 [Bacteroidetes bacterium]|nr:hypothetical protein [Bacteroidota bacterium]